jgi:hypothetical protein
MKFLRDELNSRSKQGDWKNLYNKSI